MSVKLFGSEIAYDGFIKIRKDEIEWPDGRRHYFDYVDTITAVLVLPILGDQIVMLKQYRHPLKRIVYDLPAGGVKTGEPIEDAARRELLEETGYTAQQWHSLGAFHHIPGCMDSVVHLFAATGLAPGVASPESGEFIESITVTVADFERLIDAEPMEAAVPLAYFLARRKGLIP
jgi:ADP-ribose pyrophosphatase